MKRPLKEFRPIGPFSQLDSTTSPDSNVFIELIFDTEEFASELEGVASNKFLTEGVEERDSNTISNVGLTFVAELLMSDLGFSDDDLDNVLGVVDEKIGREVVKKMGNEVSVMMHVSDLSPVEVNEIIEEFEDKGLTVKNEGGFVA